MGHDRQVFRRRSRFSSLVGRRRRREVGLCGLPRCQNEEIDTCHDQSGSEDDEDREAHSRSCVGVGRLHGASNLLRGIRFPNQSKCGTRSPCCLGKGWRIAVSASPRRHPTVSERRTFPGDGGGEPFCKHDGQIGNARVERSDAIGIASVIIGRLPRRLHCLLELNGLCLPSRS